MKRLNAAAMVFLLTCIVLAGLFVAPSYGQDCRIFRIHGQATGATALSLEPETMWVPKGTCVIWFNQTSGYEVVVKFADGKVCEDVTDAPVQFQIGAQNCYVSSGILVGATSSLRFMQPGTFAFEVMDTKGQGITKGKIIVE